MKLQLFIDRVEFNFKKLFGKFFSLLPSGLPYFYFDRICKRTYC